MWVNGEPVFTRIDGSIGFEWGESSPVEGIRADHFSVRWTRTAPFWEDNYAFCVRADDGVRLYINDAIVVDEWHASKGYEASCAEVDLLKGQHKITVEYYEQERDALIYVWWERR